jgi:glycosyltransferase involved in cell wall biosynthesis
VNYDPRVKILHLEAGRHLYGGARQAGYLIQGLAARGVENWLVCREGHALSRDTLATRVFAWPLSGDLDVTLYGRIRRLAQSVGPDVVHVHSRRGADTFGGRAARAAGVPSVLTRRVQSREPGIWLRFKARPYAAIAAISTAVRDELIRAGIARDRLRLIPSAVDTALFEPDARARARLADRYGLTPDALLAGSAAQLIPRKGLAALLPLAGHLSAAEPRFRLLLFGQGPARRALERRARTLGLERAVVFCGYEPEWPRLLPGLDLLLHPARREGLGAVVLEAMSAGVPVVASAVGGIVDAIDDGIDGRLLPPEDPVPWRDVVLELLHDPPERERLAAAARRKVETHFTIDRMTERYLSLYRELAGSG